MRSLLLGEGGGGGGGGFTLPISFTLFYFPDRLQNLKRKYLATMSSGMQAVGCVCGKTDPHFLRIR